MKHEEFNLRYYEIMYDERDAIEAFLKQQADLRYGNQMYEWETEPIELVTVHGCTARVRGIRYDESSFVKFIVDFCGDREEWECFNFAYGELSKILDMLPEPNEIVLNNAKDDIGFYCRNYNLSELLKKHPFNWVDNKSVFKVKDIYFEEDTGELRYAVYETIEGCDGGWGVWEELDTDVAVSLRDHLKVFILRCSNEYNKLSGQLNWFGGNFYNFVAQNNENSVYVTPKGTDLKLMVLDVSMEDGELKILVDVSNTGLYTNGDDDTMTLHEKDLTPDNLRALVDFFDEPDIIDTSNSHNPELVLQINKAWKRKNYHDDFGSILLAILTRDREEYENKFNCDAELTTEYAMNCAHNIMEHICDNRDLETILSFLRYDGED